MKNRLMSLLMMATLANLSAQTFNDNVHKLFKIKQLDTTLQNAVANVAERMSYYYDTTVLSKTYLDSMTKILEPMNQELMDSSVALYQQHYDSIDLQMMIQFYGSKTGQKVRTHFGLIEKEMQFVRREWEGKVVTKLLEPFHQDTLKDIYDVDTVAATMSKISADLKKAKDIVYMNTLNKEMNLYATAQKNAFDIYSRAQIATAYNQLAWYQLLNGSYVAAEENIQKGMAINVYDLYLPSNLPLSWLLQGKYRKAKKYYWAWKDKPFGEQGLDTYKDAFLDDLKNFELHGLIPAARVNDVAKIRALLK